MNSLTTPTKQPNRPAASASLQPRLTDQHRRLLAAWAWLSDEQRAAFMARMQAMAAANETRGGGHE